MFDVDKFITYVQQNPAIWDRRTPEYSDRILRERSWYIVGESMLYTWAEMAEEERQEQVKEMKKKWRHIRDSYLKFINQGKSGEPAQKKKRYAYAKVLTFLQGTFDRKRSSLNEASENDNFNDVDTSSPRKDKEATTEGDNTTCISGIGPVKQQSSSAIETGSLSKKSKSRRSAGVIPFKRQLIERQHKILKSDPEDDLDRSFLLSLLPYMRKLNAEQKLDFRLHSLQFFRDIREENTQPTVTPQTNSSYQHFLNFNSEYQSHSDVYTPANNSSHERSPYVCSLPTSLQPNMSPTVSTSPQQSDMYNGDECKVKIEVDEF